MDEEFHMGPYLQDILLAGVFQYTVEHDEVPRRDARERTHVLPGGLFRDEPHLFVEVRYQRRLLVGNAEDVGDGRRILYQDGRQVADIMLSPSRSMRLEPPSVSIFPFTTLVLG